MTHIKKIAVFLLLISALISCKKYDTLGNEIKSYNILKNANWLLGSWQHVTDSTTLSETWKRENDSTFTATSYFILNKKDTLHHETIELVENNKVLIYASVITGENNNNATSFQKTGSNESELIFENPTNSYPQKIIYKKTSESQLSETISGKINGKKQTHSYNLVKVE